MIKQRLVLSDDWSVQQLLLSQIMITDPPVIYLSVKKQIHLLSVNIAILVATYEKYNALSSLWLYSS